MINPSFHSAINATKGRPVRGGPFGCRFACQMLFDRMAALGAELRFWNERVAAVTAEFRGSRYDRLLGNVCEGLP